VDNLGASIRGLAARLSGLEAPDTVPALPDPAAIEAAYRQTLQRWFELTAQGSDANRAEVGRVHQEILRLIADVGEPRATTLRRQWAREWCEESSLCPFCGERGPYHDPDRGPRP